MPDLIISGPLFSKGGAPVAKAVHDMIRELVSEGEVLVTDQLYPGHGLVTGHYKRSINGEVLSSTHGRVHDSNVIYGPWLEGVSSRNQSSRFKGYGMFRKAKTQLQRDAPKIAEKYTRKAVGELN